MLLPIRYHRFSTNALLLEWHPARDISTLHSITAMDHAIQSQWRDELIETVPAYHSLLVIMKSTLHNPDRLISQIKNLSTPEVFLQNQKHIIEVDYSPRHGVDLDYVSMQTHFSIDQIIQVHTSATYIVHLMGFLPGFVYLSGLDPRLHIPRRSQPRIRVPKGAVAIASEQTGIYPVESPGGWHIIGHTDQEFFNPREDPPTSFRPGDTVQFVSIQSP